MTRVTGPMAALLTLLALGLTAAASPAAADGGLTAGRSIYSPDRTFAGALDEKRSWLAAELAVGIAPEGTLAAGFGARVPGLAGLEVWAHFGLEVNPALRYSGSLRYVFEFGSFRPYLGVGVGFADLYAIGSLTTNLYAEVGHQFVLTPTYRVIASLGFRWVLDGWLKGNSPLLDGTTDVAWVDEELADANGGIVTLTLRFNRRF